MVTLCDLKKEVKITYPTFWDYKLIFQTHIQADKILKELLNTKEYKLKLSNLSANKKYQSYSLSVYVKSKKERLDIFEQLKAVAKFVL